eukprot:7091632-Heterocapsa_arctica.AAC.1
MDYSFLESAQTDDIIAIRLWRSDDDRAWRLMIVQQKGRGDRCDADDKLVIVPKVGEEHSS